MIDTSTVNYALTKITEAYKVVAPSVKDISAKYVHYVITKQVLENCMQIFFTIISAVLAVKATQFAKKNWAEWSKRDAEPLLCLLILFPACAATALLIVSLINLIETGLAISSPEIWTINHLIEAAQHR